MYKIHHSFLRYNHQCLTHYLHVHCQNQHYPLVHQRLNQHLHVHHLVLRHQFRRL